MGAGVPGAFASLAGQVWYQSVAGDEVMGRVVTPLGVAGQRVGQLLGPKGAGRVPPGGSGQVPGVLGAARACSAGEGSWKSKFSVLEPRWRMMGTCCTRTGRMGGGGG